MEDFRFKALNGNLLNLTLSEFTDMISEGRDTDDYEKYFGTIGGIEVYNYLEKITSKFDEEKVKIVLIYIIVNCTRHSRDQYKCECDFLYNADCTKSEYFINYAIDVLRGKSQRKSDVDYEDHPLYKKFLVRFADFEKTFISDNVQVDLEVLPDCNYLDSLERWFDIYSNAYLHFTGKINKSDNNYNEDLSNMEAIYGEAVVYPTKRKIEYIEKLINEYKSNVYQLENRVMETQRLNQEILQKEIARLKMAFPNNTDEFFDLLCDRITYYNYSENELVSMVNNAIDKIRNLQLTIADIIGDRVADDEFKTAIAHAHELVKVVDK
jgi:hypothetical protein